MDGPGLSVDCLVHVMATHCGGCVDLADYEPLPSHEMVHLDEYQYRYNASQTPAEIVVHRMAHRHDSSSVE